MIRKNNSKKKKDLFNNKYLRYIYIKITDIISYFNSIKDKLLD